MQAIQWIVAAGTAAFVALVGFFQWRTAEQKAALDLFDRRHEIYVAVRAAVALALTDPQRFDQGQENEFLEAKERAYFFFGDDVCTYLQQLWEDISAIVAGEKAALTSTASDRALAAQPRVRQFYSVGQPLFGRYMRSSQRVPGWPSWEDLGRRLSSLKMWWRRPHP
jgi:hypothetical protein